MKGCFIAFEGANGTGKSTIINCIYDKLIQDNFDVFLTKEPSESDMGKLSRKVADNIEGRALACLVASDRFYHVENVILPKIKVLVKKWVGKYSIIYTASKLCVAMSFTV